jgi:hypothetical protein
MMAADPPCAVGCARRLVVSQSGPVALAASALVALLGAGCSLSSTSQVRFAPASGDRAAGFVTDLERSCELDECRVQTVRLVLPSGEVMTGKLRMLTSGPLLADAVAASQDRRPAAMTLAGDRGSRMQCELLFTAGARTARGACKAADGSAYAVSF